MKCPKCSSNMAETTVEGETFDRCEGCGGMWFDNLEHEHLKKAHAAEQVDTGHAGLGKRHDAVKSPPCPRCSAGMIRLTLHEQAHIHVDSCPICHGTYFDAGEFADFQKLTFSERFKRFFGILGKQ